jgi:hypothetical protein
MGLVADRRGQVDHGVGAAERLALKVAIAQPGQVAQGDLHVHAVAAQAPRVAHEGADVMSGAQQER